MTTMTIDHDLWISVRKTADDMMRRAELLAAENADLRRRLTIAEAQRDSQQRQVIDMAVDL